MYSKLSKTVLIFLCFLSLSNFLIMIITAQESNGSKSIQIIYARSNYGYSGANTDIFAMSLDGSQESNLTNDPSEDTFPVVNQNTNKIAFLSDRSGTDEIYTMNIDGSQLIQLTRNAKLYIAPIEWSPDGDFIVFSSVQAGNPDLYSVDVDTQELTNLTETVGYGVQASWSPVNNQIVFVGDGNLYLLDTSNDEIKLLYEGSGFSEDPIWSPDGEQVAFAAYIPNTNRVRDDSEIFVIDVETRDIIQLTDNSFDDSHPSWSPDGAYIAYEADVGQDLTSFEIMSVKSDGSKLPETVTSNPANDRCPIWSPDGNSIIFLSDRRVPFESNDIYKINLNNDQLLQLTETDGNERCPLGLAEFDSESH